jgi:hypothetical protein
MMRTMGARAASLKGFRVPSRLRTRNLAALTFQVSIRDWNLGFSWTQLLRAQLIPGGVEARALANALGQPIAWSAD